MIFMDGILIIDKPAGLTSHDVVARVRRMLGESRVGHTGTLDPFATGVLVVLVGRTTRLAQFLSNAEKEYEATIRLGYATETGDLTGTPIHDTRDSYKEPNDKEIDAALASLRGELDQVPPMYSAKKHAGRKLYELARRGEEIERQPLRITIHEFEALPLGDQLLSRNQDGTADLMVRVVCSAGTYVRTLAEDLGRQLGAGAHLIALKRTRAGDFRLNDALSLDELRERVSDNTLASSLLSADAALSRLPFVHLTPADAERTRHGMKVRVGNEASAAWLNGEKVRMCGEDGRLLAVGWFDSASQTLHPRVVLAPEKMAGAFRP